MNKAKLIKDLAKLATISEKQVALLQTLEGAAARKRQAVAKAGKAALALSKAIQKGQGIAAAEVRYEEATRENNRIKFK